MDLNRLVEFLDHNCRELPSPEGTFVNPGHATASMWFVLHLARRRNRDLIRRATQVIRSVAGPRRWNASET